VTGRLIEITADVGRVELGEGVVAGCPIPAGATASEEINTESKADLTALSSMLAARWKGGSAAAASSKPDPPRIGQIRSFRIAKLDPVSKRIDLTLA